ncbi:MAG: hypothetical protein JNM70_19970 [Anaerolineae bacterium]|nr:hypothetical protein [Anaerolineae bacterium]
MITAEQIQEFVQQMRKGFENTPYPGDDNIGSTGIEDIEQELVGVRWQDVTMQHLWDLRAGMVFLKPDAFRYYLPAFLLGVLQFTDELDAFSETFIPFLIPPPSIWQFIGDEGLPPPSDWYEKYIGNGRQFLALDALSAEQKKLVGLCLKMIAEIYPDRDWNTLAPKSLAQAIAYWEQYVT